MQVGGTLLQVGAVAEVGATEESVAVPTVGRGLVARLPRVRLSGWWSLEQV